MPSETQMKEALQAYIDRFNVGDAAGIAALYADDATIEDPVGTPLKKGKAEIKAFYEMAVGTGARLALSAPIRGSHGNAAAMAFEVTLDYQGHRTLIRTLDVMTFDAAGKYTSMKAYWGPGDLQVLGPA